MSDQLTMSELHPRLGKLGKDELILDVRGKDEYSEGHVPGSRNISHEEVQHHVEELRKYSRVYVHCRSGGRAKMACQTLEKLGLKNLVCIGTSGMKDWQEAGFKTEK